MNKTKIITLTSVVILLLAILLSGCQGKTENKTVKQTTPAVPVVSEPAPPVENTEPALPAKEKESPLPAQKTEPTPSTSSDPLTQELKVKRI